MAYIFDLLGNIIFFPLRIFAKRLPPDPKNILVVRLDHIGDFVCTTPVFKNIKNKYPDSKITVLINSVSKDLAYRDPSIDKVITFSPPHLSRGDSSSFLNGLNRVIKDVRNIGFDLGIDPRGDLLSILIMWLGGVRFRIGYGITGGGFLLHKEVGYNRGVHIIDRNLALLEDINIHVKDRSPSVYFNKKDEDVVEKMLNVDLNPIRDSKSVIIHPFAGAVSRGWDKNNFQDLINRLKASGSNIFIVGTKNDECRYENVVDMRGKFNLPQLAYFIKRIGCFIGLNSGPANIAAALGVPSVVISSGSNIIKDWIPPGNNIRFVYKEIACRPCERKVCPKAKYECMDGITVEEVLTKLKEINEDIL